jgi:hypothetical protein
MKRIPVYILTTALLGLFAGGSIVVLFILIPFWQTLQPAEVTEWFSRFGSQVGITMMPMEIIPLILSIYAYLVARRSKEEGKNLWIWINVSNILILIIFFIYFLPVNLKFLNKTIDPANIPGELVRWKVHHAMRTALAVLSMLLAVKACSKAYKQ